MPNTVLLVDDEPMVYQAMRRALHREPYELLFAESGEEALEVLERAPFALTAGVFSRSPAVVEEVKRRAPVGNLYVNRKCTGALVGVHPFGGFNLSGTDSKAGGRDYLLLFLQPKSIARKK